MHACMKRAITIDTSLHRKHEILSEDNQLLQYIRYRRRLKCNRHLFEKRHYLLLQDIFVQILSRISELRNKNGTDHLKSFEECSFGQI